MKKFLFFCITIVLAIFTFSFFNPFKIRDTEGSPFIIDTLAAGLYVPWDICFLPDGSLLFTERPGHVRIYRDNKLFEKPALTVPGIEVKGKMGLLGLCIHPNFKVNGFVYLAYNYRVANQTFLRVARYTFEKDSLINPVTVIENIPGVFNHTGCRLKFGPDKKLYITTGDADVPKLAQDLKAYNGKILRLNDDGTIPAGNPFLHNDTARHEIFTYGHRNSQGIAFQPVTNRLYNSEHGPTGGDEINLITKGNNYGWPVIHHRDNKDGMMSPLLEFTPSIGPAEALFYSGKAFPELKGDLLVGCMRGEAILDVKFTNNKISSYQFFLKNVYKRIRALAEGPDGYLYFSTSQIDPPESNTAPAENGFDMILRLRPSGSKIGQAFNISQVLIDKAQPAINTSHAAVTVTSVSTGNHATVLFTQLCAGCHGADLNGKDSIPSLVDNIWKYGGSKADIQKSISSGVIAKGMPAWEGVLSDKEIGQVAGFILSKKKEIIYMKTVLIKKTRPFLQTLIICLLMFTAAFSARQPAGAYQVQNKATGLLLRPMDASSKEGTPIVVYEKYAWRCMTWDFIPAKDSGTFLLKNYFTHKTFKADAAKENTELKQTTIQQQPLSQQWHFVKVADGYYKIQAIDSDLVLTVDGDGTNAKVVLRKFTNTASQLWKLLPKPGEFTG